MPGRIGDGKHVNDWILDWAAERDIPASESLPCLWPGDGFIEVEEGSRYADRYYFRFAEDFPVTPLYRTDPANFVKPPVIMAAILILASAG